MTSENIKVAGALTEEQINSSVANIVRPFNENSLPKLRLQNNGSYAKLTEDEIETSCSSFCEDILR